MRKIACFITMGILVIYIAILYIFYYNTLPQNIFNALTSDNKIIVDRANIRIKRGIVPRVTVDSLAIGNILNAKHMNVSFSLLSLFVFQPKISSIEIQEFKMTFDGACDNDMFSCLSKVYSMIGREECNIKLKNVYLINASNETIGYLYDVICMSNNSNLYQVKAQVNNNSQLNAAITIGQEPHVNFMLESNYHRLEFNGTLTSGLQLPGKYKLFVNNFSKYINENYIDIDFVTTLIQNEDKLEITFDINTTDDGGISVDNINITADFVKAVGNFIFWKRKDKVDIINLRFKTLVLDKLFTAANNNELQNNNNIIANIYFKDTLKIPKHNSNITISFDDIRYQKENLVDLSLTGTIKDAVLYIDNIIGKVKSGGNFRLDGIVEQNQYRSMFKGKLELQHQDINTLLTNLGYNVFAATTPQPMSLRSDITLTPINYYAENIDLKLNNSQIGGYVHMRQGGGSNKLLTQLVLNDIDLNNNEYPAISALVEYYKDLIHVVSDNDYLVRFTALNSLGYRAYINLNFKSITFPNQKQPSKINLVLNLSPGRVKVNNIYYRSGYNEFLAQAQLFTNTVTPNIDINISKGICSITGAKEQAFNYLKLLIDNLKYKRFTLSVAANLDQLLFNNQQYNNFAVKFSNSADFINIDNISISYKNNAELILKGNILINPLSSTFVYAYNSFYIPDFSFILSDKNYTLPKGFASMNGTFSTSGDDLQEIKHNINVNGKFIAKDIILEKINFESIIKNLLQQDLNINDVNNEISIDNTSGYTNISTAKGSFSFVNGVLKFDDCTINTAPLNGNINGIVNLQAKTIDFVAKLKISDQTNETARYLLNKNLNDLNLHVYGPYNKLTRIIKFG